MRDESGRPRTLSFDPSRRPGGGEVGCVHRDGSITYQGTLYRTLRDVPPSCTAFRADLPVQVMWRKMYRAVDPKKQKR